MSGHGQVAKDCVTNSGFLAYAGTASGHVQLTSFSRSVPAGSFTPPAGATTETLPAGVSIP